MKLPLIQLLHNPKAGAGKYTAKQLLSLIKDQGFDCRYFSTKDQNLKVSLPETDILLIAGGDGTLRKMIAKLLDQKLMKRPDRLAIFPLGTANNVARSLGLIKQNQDALKVLHSKNQKPFDVGRLNKLKGNKFFLESFGIGLFPCFMSSADSHAETVDSPEKQKKLELQKFLKSVSNYPSFKCKLEIDGKDHSGNYILLEVMNTPLMGPNLRLSPDSDPGDGLLEVVLITDKERKKLLDYISARIKGLEKKPGFKIIRCKKIELFSEVKHVHVDDQLLEPLKKPIKIGVKAGLLNFLAL